jgi:D-arabinono-1,4-lactone oxidase/FAD binding domain
MKRRGYFYVALATTLNVIIYALTLGRYLWLEGRVRGGVFRNWGRRYRYRPENFLKPSTEEEIVALVKKAKGVRFYGAAHSFNNGVVADETLFSLDNYKGILWKNLETKQVAFKGGTRIRECAKLLLDEGLAFGALPSHDAQSIAGIISTDVHGTGRDWGFVSFWVESFKLVDGQGVVHECKRGDDLFKTAIGGIGAPGIIFEVVVKAVDRFNVEQKVHIANLTDVENNFDQLFAENEHMSLYLFPFTGKCQINTWNKTEDEKSVLGPLREFLSISNDALLSAWFGGFMANSGLLPKLSRLAYSFKIGTDLVMESNKAFNRTIYPLHQELEFTIPFEKTFEMCRRFIKLYEDMYREEKLPYALFEIRFTPAGHDLTLIGAGHDRRSTWINLVLNDSTGFERYYAAAEELMKEEDVDARPHMGKYCQSFTPADMQRLHGQNFTKFIQIARQHDPEGKFVGDYTRRTFGL